MKVAVLEAVGSLDNIRIVERPEPKPGPREVLVRLRAASLNFRDLVVVEGGYGARQKKQNLVMLSDGAGEIVELGSEVADWRVGDRVVGCFFPDWQAGPPTERRIATSLGGSVDGVACEYRVFDQDAILRGPKKRVVHYMETAAGDTSIGHATAHAQLVESLAECRVPPRARPGERRRRRLRGWRSAPAHARARLRTRLKASSSGAS